MKSVKIPNTDSFYEVFDAEETLIGQVRKVYLTAATSGWIVSPEVFKPPEDMKSRRVHSTKRNATDALAKFHLSEGARMSLVVG